MIIKPLTFSFLAFALNSTLAMEEESKLVIKTAAIIEQLRQNPPPPSPTIWQRRTHNTPQLAAHPSITIPPPRIIATMNRDLSQSRKNCDIL
jgi:hypothetical protein